VVIQTELQNGDKYHCYIHPDFNVYCDRLVLLMSDVNKNDSYAINSTSLYMKSDKFW
jgi:hypothetical protein